MSSPQTAALTPFSMRRARGFAKRVVPILRAERPWGRCALPVARVLHRRQEATSSNNIETADKRRGIVGPHADRARLTIKPCDRHRRSDADDRADQCESRSPRRTTSRIRSRSLCAEKPIRMPSSRVRRATSSHESNPYSPMHASTSARIAKKLDKRDIRRS